MGSDSPACLVVLKRRSNLTSSAIQRDSNALPFFSVVPAYVLLFKDEDGDWCVDTVRTEVGRAVTCFLSPFDAVIEAAYLTRRGQPHQVMAASQIEETVIRCTTLHHVAIRR